MPARRSLTRLRAAVIGIVLVLGLVACVAAPRIVGSVYPPISPLKVRVFISNPHSKLSRLIHQEIPLHYTVVAKLDPLGYGGCDSPGVDRIVLARLRRQASRLGANGVLLVLNRHITVYSQIVPGVNSCPQPRPLPTSAEAIDVPSPKS
jgi:hypothetical protein